MFEGACTAMVTPFRTDGKVDEDGLRANVGFQIKQGIHGLVPCGTTGESPTLSYEEHNRVIEVVVDAANGKVPVLAGTGSNSTWETIMLTKHAKEVGADGALVVVPYYNKPTQAGLYAHFKKVAEEIDIPQVIYNIPSRTGVNMLPDTMAKLAKLKNIVGVKEASGDLKQIARIIELARGEDFLVTSGDDLLTLDLMKLGGKGIISVASNIIPDRVVKLVDTVRKGDLKAAEGINDGLKAIFKALFVETNPGPVKMAMKWIGMPAGGLRMPLVEPSPDNQAKLRKVLVEMGLLKK